MKSISIHQSKHGFSVTIYQAKLLYQAYSLFIYCHSHHNILYVLYAFLTLFDQKQNRRKLPSICCNVQGRPLPVVCNVHVYASFCHQSQHRRYISRRRCLVKPRRRGGRLRKREGDIHFLKTFCIRKYSQGYVEICCVRRFLRCGTGGGGGKEKRYMFFSTWNTRTRRSRLLLETSDSVFTFFFC